MSPDRAIAQAKQNHPAFANELLALAEQAILDGGDSAASIEFWGYFAETPGELAQLTTPGVWGAQAGPDTPYKRLLAQLVAEIKP